ncbi:hypothetical protein COCC4DRAFT_133385, partial [Bipolaris maydis ATCC 48331]
IKSCKTKTYDSGYSPVVTHLTINPPINCLSTAEQSLAKWTQIYLICLYLVTVL